MRTQRGFALMLTLLMLLLVGVAVFLGAQPNASRMQAQRIIREADAIDAARDALAAYALAGGKGTPGALPCPDMDRDGTTNNLKCQAPGPEDPAYWLGRLPYATLDVSGEIARSGMIWYALDDDFLDFSPPTDPTLVNPASEASLRIDGSDDHYAAILILAHDPVGTDQVRPSENVGDYLEGENDNGDTVFASCDTGHCNDRVIGISKKALFAPVRVRLLGELRIALDSIYRDLGAFPWAAELGDPDGTCSPHTNRGNLPVDGGPCGASFVVRKSAGGPLPDWIIDNRWYRYVYYAVAESCELGDVCDANASDLLSLDGHDGKAVIFGLTGVPTVSSGKGAMQNREGAVPQDVIEYLDSHENMDGNNAFDDPANGGGENDYLRAIAAAAP